MIVLITGGRMVRYSAMHRERIAGAIAPWAAETAAEVDAYAPNQAGSSTRPRVTRSFARSTGLVHVSLVHSLARIKRRLTVVVYTCSTRALYGADIGGERCL